MCVEKSLFFMIIITCVIITASLADNSMHDDDDNEDRRSKGDSETTAYRFTSPRAYINDRGSKREGFRYYGTGSKSGNSFAPTSIHKSTSALDSHNYFITSKGVNKVKDMDTASTGMSGNGDGNNYLTVYEPPRDNPGATNYMIMPNGNSGTMEEAFGEMAAETGHGGGYGHGGHGHGGKGCNSALGLLGVLGLAAYLQNVLRNMQMQNGDGDGGNQRRAKREIRFEETFDPNFTLENIGDSQLDSLLLPLNETNNDTNLDPLLYNKVMKNVFPLLSAVAHARDGLIPIHCTHSSVCLANQILARDLGSLGHSIGIRISSAISQLLTTLTNDEKAEQIRMISKAGKMGRNGRNCLKVFPTCNRLRRLPTYNIPAFIGSA